MSDPQVKPRGSEFYDRVGWQVEADGFYQNARYEDLRPVSAEYIHKCHLRVNRHLAPEGRYLLDAGSGPVQYPEYQTYSQGYQRRVCADISHVALKEARKRLGDHGLDGGRDDAGHWQGMLAILAHQVHVMHGVHAEVGVITEQG